ncbi:hypothetical protein KZ483_18570 [Paenibacillus sp. sptzw28]|uniref:tetratricopeptide repeat protein n=1 Tax=Paenibacillus sp. sptzw28 TaxID=715179 RepID=UPI001C6EC573|nr:tetratricopeptide repeat protein [Paenibacillus sp. sptzw28]QYR19869.1 hypothetical protein KZ483_18570 [Paenibacillus sp. sptzw28]
MFKHVFGAMHEVLDEIILHYPHASADQTKQYDEQLAVLRQFSETFIEQWLQFEEKMADFRDLQSGQLAQQHSAASYESGTHVHKPVSEGTQPKPIHACAAQAAAESALDAEALREQSMMKGQGYFKLFMFREAADHFQEAVHQSPDDNCARLFLAMTFMHLQEWHEAQRHFQLLVEVTDHPKWRALGLNALGCIQAVRMNLEQAERYFEKAHEADPDFADPLSNIKSCQQQNAGHLSLYFGSGQL